MMTLPRAVTLFPSTEYSTTSPFTSTDEFPLFGLEKPLNCSSGEVGAGSAGVTFLVSSCFGISVADDGAGEIKKIRTPAEKIISRIFLIVKTLTSNVRFLYQNVRADDAGIIAQLGPDNFDHAGLDPHRAALDRGLDGLMKKFIIIRDAPADDDEP